MLVGLYCDFKLTLLGRSFLSGTNRVNVGVKIVHLGTTDHRKLDHFVGTLSALYGGGGVPLLATAAFDIILFV